MISQNSHLYKINEILLDLLIRFQDIIQEPKIDPTKQQGRTLPAVIRWHEQCKGVYVICSVDNWVQKHQMLLDKADRRMHNKQDM